MQHAVFIQTELQLGIGDDDAAPAGVTGREGVNFEGFGADLFGQLGADFVHHHIEADIFVVITHGRFGAGGENRLRQLFGLAQTGRKSDAADGAVGLIVFPARTDDVAAGDGFHR